MSKFIGRLADVGIAKETTRGTVETTATFWLPKLSLSYDDVIEQVVDESSVGVIEDSADSVVVSKSGVGEIEGYINDKSFGLILLAALGTVSTTTTQSTAYIHTYSVQEDAQCDSLTIFQDDPNQDYKYALAMVDSLEIDVTVGQLAKFTVGFRSKAGGTATLTPTYTAENKFLPQHGSLTYADALSGLDAGTSVPLRSAVITFSKNVEDDRNLGSLDPTDILNKQMAVEGTLELVFDTNAFKTDMLAGTARAIRLRLTNTDVTIGSSLNPRLTIDLAKVKFGEFTRNYGNDEIVTVSVSFKALYSISDSKLVAVELRNANASY